MTKMADLTFVSKIDLERELEKDSPGSDQYEQDRWQLLYDKLEDWHIPYWLRRIYCFFWRGAKGWCAMDTWGLHNYFDDVIPASIKYLRRHSHGHPTDMSYKEWLDKLDDMIYYFETRAKISNYELLEYDAPQTLRDLYEKDGKRAITEFEHARMERGRVAFEKYYGALWN